MTQIRIKDAKVGFDLPNMDKNKVHKEMQEQFFKTGSIDSVKYKDCHAKGIIIDENGFICLQTRPSNAKDNCSQIDASWGSHIEAGDTTITSAMYESARELSIATTVLEEQFFFSMLENHPDILSELSITRQIAHIRNYFSERILPDGKKWIEPCELTLFVSYFKGKFRPDVKDGAGLIFYNLDTLKKEIEKNPEKFTGDMKYIVKNFSHLLIPYKDLPGFNPNPDFQSNELVQLYDLKGNPIEPKQRKEIHKPMKEAFEKGEAVPFKHRHVRLMLRRPDGTYYLQQRSILKKENPGLIDKPIGGHVGLGDIYDSAMIHECNDELGIAAAALPEEDFNAVIKHRPEILEHQAVLMKIAVIEDYISKRQMKGGEFWEELNDSAIYFGYYNGVIKFKDGETSGVEVRSIEELNKELKDHPEKYTLDLKDLVELLEKRGIVK